MKRFVCATFAMLVCFSPAASQSSKPVPWADDATRNRDLERLLANLFTSPKPTAKPIDLFSSTQPADRRNLVAMGGKPQDGNIEKLGKLVADTPKNIKEIRDAQKADADRWKEWDKMQPKK